MSARRGPERVETARLVLRRPQASEANPIFARYRAMTGYVLARDAGGRGYATEALGAMVETTRTPGVRRLYALCHHEHRASATRAGKVRIHAGRRASRLFGVSEPEAG